MQRTPLGAVGSLIVPVQPSSNPFPFSSTISAAVRKKAFPGALTGIANEMGAGTWVNFTAAGVSALQIPVSVAPGGRVPPAVHGEPLQTNFLLAALPSTSTLVPPSAQLAPFGSVVRVTLLPGAPLLPFLPLVPFVPSAPVSPFGPEAPLVPFAPGAPGLPANFLAIFSTSFFCLTVR